MSSSVQLREEIFPGYSLTERIGSGGYAEVWRARAPGGIDKAVKIVYGYYDDQLAAQEMKAMERIKGVRHPFVLSLERFEVVDGRLAILTELADMSLEQRAQQCRVQGLPGIPRDELLRYMTDAAEALDYLAQRHGLQHLDIKPANLLVMGDHVKVADFGLVKELASRTHNSMVAGMTPTYSSPEMFDDAPSPHSDQYSLAIVYQELLTGVLPFPGRTAAQLSNQHLRSQPQLAAMPESDRPAVARALAKNPAERFPTCRDFVKALIDVVNPAANRVAHRSAASDKSNEPSGNHGQVDPGAPSTTSPRTANPMLPQHSPSNPPSNPPASSPASSPANAANATQPTEVQERGLGDTKAEPKLAARLRLNEDMVDVAAPDVASAVDATPTLYIAVGGVGIRILCRLRDLLARRASDSQPAAAVEMLAIDTDPAEIKDACSATWSNPLKSSETLYLPLRLPQDYRNEGQRNLDWLSHRWLYNIPRSLETRGYRPLGRLALVDHLDKALSLIDRKLELLAANHAADGDRQAPKDLHVVLLAGMGGGTGGGMAIDLANAARSRVHALGRQVQIQAVFVCTCMESVRTSPLSAANTYALLTELQFASEFGNQGSSDESHDATPLESPNRPFDLVYCLPIKHHADASVDDGFSSIAKQLSLASTEGVRQMLVRCRRTATPRELAGSEPLLLRTFGTASLARLSWNRRDRLAAHLARTMTQHWLENACTSEWRRLDRASDGESCAKIPPPRNESVETAAVAPGSSNIPSAGLRNRFGEHASTRFAYEVVSRICRQSSLCGAYRTALLSSKNPKHFMELASHALALLGKQATESPEPGDRLSEEDEIMIQKLAPCGNRVLTKLIDEIENMSADSPFDAAATNRIITTECIAAVDEALGQCAIGESVESNPANDAGVQQALDRANVDLLQCGYDRRTLIFAPSDHIPSEAIEALTRARPTAASISADVEESIIVCEGSGISPTSFASGLEWVFPGIAEAASRLFTRIDTDWSARSLKWSSTPRPPDKVKLEERSHAK
jgi:serine/threonine protein kinase